MLIQRYLPILAIVVALTTVMQRQPAIALSNDQKARVLKLCKAELKRHSTRYDVANAKAKTLKTQKKKKQTCRYGRQAMAGLNGSLRSFKSGKCRRVHTVVSSYVSSKLKRLEANILSTRNRLTVWLKKECR